MLHENIHRPWITDRRHTIQSEVVSVVILEAGKRLKCILVQADIIRNQRIVPLPINVDSPRAQVGELLGMPNFNYPETDIYVIENDIGADRITIRYDEGRITSITWNYFVD